jgi:NRDE-2, necessary for RNA interference
MTASDEKYKYEEIDGFLRLPSRRGRQNKQSYREITLAKNESDSESSDACCDESSDSDSDSVSLTSHQQTLKSLEQQITSDPSSVTAWLSLLSQSLSAVPHTSKNATKARSEIALSILSRALSSHPQNGTSIVLRLKHLKAGEEVWHESKLRAEWEECLTGGGIEIWMEWMEWRIRRATRGINGVMEDGERVLRSLGDGEDDEIGKLRVFWRVAVALKDAGMLPVSAISILGLNILIQVTRNVRQLSSKPKLNCKPVP